MILVPENRMPVPSISKDIGPIAPTAAIRRRCGTKCTPCVVLIWFVKVPRKRLLIPKSLIRQKKQEAAKSFLEHLREERSSWPGLSALSCSRQSSWFWRGKKCRCAGLALVRWRIRGLGDGGRRLIGDRGASRLPHDTKRRNGSHDRSTIRPSTCRSAAAFAKLPCLETRR